MEFLNLPDSICENAEFMALINKACSAHAARLAARQNVAHRLRLLEAKEEGMDLKVVESVRKELHDAEVALQEAMSMIDDLKALVANVAERVNLASTSQHSIDSIRSHRLA